MDSHFEVILDRVKSLTTKTQKTVWFETQETTDGSSILILISEDNRIGLVNVTYHDNQPSLYATKLSKNTYEQILQSSVTIDSLKNNNKKQYPPKEVVKWVSGL